MFGLAFTCPIHAEVILQYFNTSWSEIATRMPELAEAGFTALWLPPPFKAGSQFSVGYDTFDRFDFGSKNQMGGIPTRYGTAGDLLNMMEIAHRFGLRVYFDNVMAHNGGPIPGSDENTSVNAQPGFVPEDFHLLRRPDGTFHKPSDDVNYADEWQSLNRNQFAIDIAQENPNTSFGANENDDFPKYSGIRQPSNPELYPDLDLTVGTNGFGQPVHPFANKEPFQDVGYGPGNIGAGNGKFDWDDTNANGQHDVGEASEPFTDTGVDPSNPARRTTAWGYGDGKYNMGNPTAEDVNQLLFRTVRWFEDVSYADGFRLDAVKHVPGYFFGQQSGADKNLSNFGYCGQIQEQFNITRGYSDWDNHRETIFNDQQARDDAMIFGEHLGEPANGCDITCFPKYLDAGMRIDNNGFYNALFNAVPGYGNLTGMDQPGWGSYGGVGGGVITSGSHDFSDISIFDRTSAHALQLTRAGLPTIYTDGYNEEKFPDANNKFFPAHGNNAIVGEFGDKHLPNLLYINQLFARGDQVAKWSDAGYCAYERRDKRENTGMSDADGTVLLYMMARNGSGGGSRDYATTFPVGARLVNYSIFGGPFQATVAADGRLRNDSNQLISAPAGGYFAFSWRNPEMPLVWDDGMFGQVQPITILQDGQPVGTLSYERKGGRDDDPNFNPYNVPGDPTNDYRYVMTVPRITSGSNLTFIARADGSAANILLKLDGGVDLNSQMGLGPQTGAKRDNPPALSTDVFLGYEQPAFARRIAEKFAARDVSRNVIGSPGCETYQATIGTAGFTVNNGTNIYNTANGTVSWVYHDPVVNNQKPTPTLQFFPAPQSAANQPVTIWVKIGYTNQVQKAFVYYTTDGTSFPEGSAGVGKGTTQFAELTFDSNGTADGSGTPVWWKTTLPALPGGTVLRYKAGVYRTDAAPWFPFNASDITMKKRMETIYQITNFNAQAVSYHPHNDYGVMKTGVEEGFHVLRTETFLKRDNPTRASVYNLNVQTIYYDTKTPEGAIVFPANDNDTLTGSRYGVLVRTDRSTSEVWYRITDNNPLNDDGNTGVTNGNAVWAKALLATPTPGVNSSYPLEWRFDYINIANTGTAAIEVRLRELSSSINMNLTDVAGHYTTLTRTVNTAGPPQQMFIAFPSFDGQVIGAGYVMKCNFSQSLADGLSTEQLIEKFTMTIDGVARAPSEFSISFNETADHHALAFTFPNLYDGFPDNQHPVQVTFNRTGYPILVANRIVLAQPVVTPYVNIVTPPAVDDNNQLYKIVLPDVANPVTSQRVYQVQVDTGLNAQSLQLFFTQGSGTLVADPTNPTTNGNFKTWLYAWNFPLTNAASLVEGHFQLRANVDTDGNPGTVEAFTLRDATVVLRELIVNDANDTDDDDDGIADLDETTPKPLPTTPTTDWNNGDVHTFYIYGRTNPLSPDSDGDGLPDGLELGWRGPTSAVNTNADTDGDGFPNFRSDLDPPFYNTAENYGNVPNVDAPNQGNKTDLKAGTTTDPSNPDTDGDGLPDGVEDANRNGWVDGDGATIAPNVAPSLARNWPNGKMDAGEVWTETDPNNSDTDGDGATDGYGEDKNFNGKIDGDTNVDRVRQSGELWTETDPLNRDTDGDDLPDGWEVNNSLDPLDSGTLNMRTGGAGNPINGASGDPDNDGASNLQELINGTNPRFADGGVPPPPGAITIGPGPTVVVGTVTNRNEFSDWSKDDLIALDPYDDLALPETSGGDVFYRPWASDGFESSRDLVAFYARDGGAADGKFYFRVDVHDLKALAENNNLNVYVVIDTGNTAVGERKMVDDIDVLTDMRWEAVVAVYDSANGRVYVNTPGSVDSTGLADDISQPQYGIQARDQNSADGFKQAYFNSDLDSIEFSISRKALTDAGWNGDPTRLNCQVFTSRDNTGGGSGELDGPDITDCIRTDWIAEDEAGITKGDVNRLRYEARIQLTTLTQWVGINADNDRGKRIKLISVAHGNQAIQPGNYVQDLINNGAGSGYYRPLDAHEAFGVPLTMHITPTLASAIQWAKVDPAANKPWRDGPAFNARIASLIATGRVDLLASTFSDHMLPYFTDAFNTSDISLATEFLQNIYGASAVSQKVLWTPERLSDGDTLTRIKNSLGFGFTFIDQMQHIRGWFGYTAAIGVDGYRLNEINGVKCFPIIDQYNDLRFSNTDKGPPILLRQLLNRRARTGQWNDQHPQVFTLFSNWEDFSDKSKADAYDANIRWMASKGWIEFVTPDQIANNQVDISVPPNGTGDVWNTINRGTGLTLPKRASDWINFSSQGNYDNWYNGSALNQSLNSLVFNIRTGVPLPTPYGKQTTSGIAKSAWDQVAAIANQNSLLAKLARAVIDASVFETAFHTQTTNPANLTKFTDGTYVYPDTTSDNVINFARIAQAQTRVAAIYKRVDTWATAAQGGAYNSSAVAGQEDIDLDGENEYLLYNDRVFAVFERIGGRMTAAWVRDLSTGAVLQALGNLASYAGSDTESEGNTNATGVNPNAFRTSGLKDWFAQTGGVGVGTSQYVNDLYTAASAPSGTGWQFTSADGKIVKRITLAAGASTFSANYAINGGVSKVYVRSGLSPHLYDLLMRGQQNLTGLVNDGQTVGVLNNNGQNVVRSFIRYAGSNNNATYNTAAIDDDALWDTLVMRNQAQTQQVELEVTNAANFQIGFETGSTLSNDTDGDGLPDGWEMSNGLDRFSGTGVNGADGDLDGDGMSNIKELIAGTLANNSLSVLRIVSVTRLPNGNCTIVWTSTPERSYEVWATTNLTQPYSLLSGPNPVPSQGATTSFPDPSAGGTNKYYKIKVAQ